MFEDDFPVFGYQHLSLYVVLDLFSRFVVTWMVSRKENSALAKQLMDEATARYGIEPGQLQEPKRGCQIINILLCLLPAPLSQRVKPYGLHIVSGFRCEPIFSLFLRHVSRSFLV